MIPSYTCIIGNERVRAEKTFEQRNPANLDEVTGLWPSLSRADTCRAVEAAKSAFPAWAARTAFSRAEILKKAHRLLTERREALANAITLENGKTIKEGFGEVDAALREMEYQIHEGVR
ncbi:MAG: aldehyde dehydrogenase family protein, partial [Bacillota bacterium]